MGSIYFKKILNLFNYLILQILLFLVKTSRQEIKNKTLLLIRLDSIGDYVLFRNFLKEISKSEKYGDYKVTLCGNIIWKDLAETLDSNYVNNFVWVNRKRFYKDPSYKYKLLSRIYKSGYETTIDTTYSREILYGDAVVRASNSKIKIGSSGSLDKHVYWKRKIFSRSTYNEVIQQSRDTLFEFYRNKEFFEKLLNKKMDLKYPQIYASKLEEYRNLPKKYCVVFAGSNDPKRRWSPRNYAEICKYLISEFQLPVVIPLAGNEIDIANKLTQIVNDTKLIDLTGKTSLVQLAKIISDSELLISNDTAAVHIAAAVDKQFLCISNGSYLGRFLPYPKEVFSKGNYIFPDKIANAVDKPAGNYLFGSSMDINEIAVDVVKNKIKQLLN